jgi:hypothetical protein
MCQKTRYKVRERKQTFWPKRNTDSVCKHVDAFEDARTALNKVYKMRETR